MKKKFLLPLLLSVLLNSCASSYFYDLAIARTDKSFLSSSPDLGEIFDSGEIPDFKASWFEKQDYVTLTLQSRDNLKLTGYWVSCHDSDNRLSNRTVILFHGYSGRAFNMGVFAEYFYELGFNVLAPDARGHGASEGDYIGFGWPERKDVVSWSSEVLKITGNDSSIVLFGLSMGGATVMMAGGEDLPVQIKAIVEDCGYSTIRAELSYQLERMYGITDKGLIDDVVKLTQQRAGYNINEASAPEQLQKSKVPMLFIHGDKDTFVPTHMVFEVYQAHPGPKKLFIVKGAGHGLFFLLIGKPISRN